MNYREFTPPPELAPYVRCFWALRSDPHAEPRELAVEPILPDGCMELVVHWGEPFVRVHEDERTPQSRAFLVGQIREPFVVAPSGHIGVIGARFEIGGATPWLRGAPAQELTGREVALHELASDAHGELVERIADACDDRARADVLATWLSTRMHRGTRHPAVGEAARWLERTQGRVAIDALNQHLGLSARQVQRLFAEQVGLGPKLCGRIARFQGLLGAMRDGGGRNFAAHAVHAGYADQAHLIRDFREFAGTTPRAWVESHTPLAAALSGFEA